MQELINNAGQINYQAALIVLRDAYERMYGIYDHQKQNVKRPMSLVAKHPAEDIYTHSRAYNSVRRFIENDVYGSTGCNLQDFLALPREYTKLVMATITEKRNRKNQTATEIERRLKQELNAGGKL